MRAIVVDDSRAMRSILAKMLRDLGYDVIEAAHGKEGLERLASGPAVDLALVDWNMPEMDGLSFVRALRQDRTYAGIKVMMVTAETDMAKVARALMAGADEYAMKPLTRDTIVEKLSLMGMSGS